MDLTPHHARFYAVTRASRASAVDAPAKLTRAHHELLGESPVTGGIASFDSGSAQVAYAAVYAGEGDDETVLGVAPVNAAGTVSVSAAGLQHMHIDRKTGAVTISPDPDEADHPSATVIAPGA